MAKYDIKIIARRIRKEQALSIGQIAKRLGASKSSVSLWCRDIILTEEQIRDLRNQEGNIRGRLMGAESNRSKKRKAIEINYKEAFAMLKKVSHRDLLIAGICLFWGEGSKTGSRFIFINSDPFMLKVMKDFLLKIIKINKEDIYATIQINKIHESRMDVIVKFWSRYLEIPLNRFSKPYYINVKPKKIYENHDNYYGILRLRVLRGSNLQYKMLGLLESFKKYYMSM
ncbi:MAG: hypothetical protein WAW92_03810 [Minisyncoccia bacterium]